MSVKTHARASFITLAFMVPLVGHASIDTALVSGELNGVQASELESHLLSYVDEASTLFDSIYVELANLNSDGSVKLDGTSLTSLEWDPTHDSAILQHSFGTNAPLFPVKGQSQYWWIGDVDGSLGVIGEAPSRFLALGGNPTRLGAGGAQQTNTNAAFDQFLRNAIAWLTQDDDLTRPMNIVAAQLDDSYWFKDASGIRQWVDTEFEGAIVNGVTDSDQWDMTACNGVALSGCLQTPPDLLIVSQFVSSDDNNSETIDSIVQAVTNAQLNGVPVLYVHWDGSITELGEGLFDIWKIKWTHDNYDPYYEFEQSTSTYDLTALLGQTKSDVQSIETIVRHLRDNSFTFSFLGCQRSTEWWSDCKSVDGSEEQFWGPLRVIRDRFKSLDLGYERIFEQDLDVYPELYKVERFVALLGDAYRKNIQYPMDKDTTSLSEYSRALFADHSNVYSRAVNEMQPDLGNFSRTDFSTTTRYSDQTILITSLKRFKSTGLYAFPGETVTVTRNDSSDAKARIVVNSLREASTRIFEEYNRPFTLRSNPINIDPGQTIVLTSPYGGPIQVEFDENRQNISLTFQNVGKHPYWSGADDTEQFKTDLEANEFDWAEFNTPYFEVHSKREKMLETVEQFGYEQLGELATRYTHNYPNVVAGLTGPGIDVVPEISNFASSKGWQLGDRDEMQHFNADQSSCAYGCSGNPYDAFWSFDPLGHGDIHELGHNLESGRMRLEGWNFHASTNWYVYYSQSKYNENVGSNAKQCSFDMPFQEQFEAIASSLSHENPGQYMQDNYWPSTDWLDQSAMAIQMWMSAQKQGVVENGWHTLARLHILERAFDDARRSDEAWAAARDGLGFSDYSRSEAGSISNNNWMLIAMSVVTEHDYTDYFQTWGIALSSKALDQVAKLGHQKMPVEFFMTSGNDFCHMNKNGDFLGKLSLPVSADMKWPDETDANKDGVWDALEYLVAPQDSDGDGISDDEDNCPLVSNADQLDTDSDGSGDVCDTDDDGDGVADADDAFPLDESESLDTDGDGVGNNADTDDDGDGFSDTEELTAGTDPLNSESIPSGDDEGAGGLPIWMLYIATQPKAA